MAMALLGALAWNLAHASKINDLRLSSGATGTRAEIVLDGEAEVRTLSLSGPDRLVVDLPGSELAANLKVPGGAGIVKAVRTGHPVAGTTRIVFDLAQPVAVLKPRMESGAAGPSLVLEWPGDGAGASTAAVAAATPAAAGAVTVPASAPATVSGSIPARQPSPAGAEAAAPDSAASAAATTRLITELAARAAQQSPSQASPAPAGATVASAAAPRNAAPALAADPAPRGRTLQDMGRGAGMRPLIIAIDAGHGGQDPGAIGPNGKREKDVTLAVARELARQVNATPGLKAYLTRDTDVFIPLNRRAVLARQAKADMFVSIHADAAHNHSARGASVYVLSLRGATSQRARWLADKENASDMIGGVRLQETSNTLANVLIDLTQSGQMKASEEAAVHVLDSLGRIGHKRRVEKANFAVLRTSDMPAMLVETGFISNPEEERLLTSPGHQRKLAAAVLEGVNAYFVRQPPPGTLYAARASAEIAGASGPGGSP
ncbi:N-acetylmuramoyl-L-alanine amidase [Marilutibacter maris]|uniref:N-acetylmuramoyl-L-alanine amidase AmiC n=3 Tax=Marilutibacter maris TaxID=1605891 RepID=A0A2U9T8X4_9GAMM|nr:N-acetylmuramoyl-L-alanine amidase [Lysobacter maris]AWV07687.1 hypothetical protein C9I47_2001 [Lysobacter maris]